MIEVFRNTKKRNEKDVVRRPFFVGLDVKDVNDYKLLWFAVASLSVI